MVRPSPQAIRKRLSQEIRRAREEAGITQEMLADQLGVGVEWVRDVENGKQYVIVDEIPQISFALGVDPMQLLSMSLVRGTRAAPVKSERTKRKSTKRKSTKRKSTKRKSAKRKSAARRR